MNARESLVPALSCFVIIWSLVAAAEAAEFNVQVPVKLSKLEEGIDRVVVRCEATGPQAGGSGNEVIGHAETPLTVGRDGGLTATANLNFNASAGKNAAAAEAVTCTLHYAASTTQAFYGFKPFACSAASAPSGAFIAKPGTPCTLTRSRNLP